jgi:hypothetical protein
MIFERGSDAGPHPAGAAQPPRRSRAATARPPPPLLRRAGAPLTPCARRLPPWQRHPRAAPGFLAHAAAMRDPRASLQAKSPGTTGETVSTPATTHWIRTLAHSSQPVIRCLGTPLVEPDFPSASRRVTASPRRSWPPRKPPRPGTTFDGNAGVFRAFGEAGNDYGRRIGDWLGEAFELRGGLLRRPIPGPYIQLLAELHARAVLRVAGACRTTPRPNARRGCPCWVAPNSAGTQP